MRHNLQIMKLCLNFLFIFSFTIFSAQNKELNFSSHKKTDPVNIDFKNAQHNSSDSILTTESKENPIISGKKTESTEELIADQNTNIVQEINAVLNYKVNRVWKRDLYCLVCENYDSGRLA